jgi:hypothetical protein
VEYEKRRYAPLFAFASCIWDLNALGDAPNLSLKVWLKCDKSFKAPLHGNLGYHKACHACTTDVLVHGRFECWRSSAESDLCQEIYAAVAGAYRFSADDGADIGCLSSACQLAMDGALGHGSGGNCQLQPVFADGDFSRAG